MIFVMVNAGTNVFTNITVKSILKYHPTAKIFVVDVVPSGQEYRPFRLIDEDDAKNVEVIRGIDFDKMKLPTVNLTKSQGISEDAIQFLADAKEDVEHFPILRSGDINHTLNIQYAIDTIGENFVLIDSDAPLIRPIDFCESIIDFTVADITQPNGISRRMTTRGYYSLGCGNHRFLPFIQYMNVKKFKNNGIFFYDESILSKYTYLSAYRFRSHSKGILFPTGSLLFGQLASNEFEFARINHQKYVDHFSSASWNIGSRKPKDFYLKNRGLFEGITEYDEIIRMKIDDYGVVLTTQENKERIQVMNDRFKECGLCSPTPIYGITHRSKLTNVRVGHIKCLEYAKQNKYPYVTIFEDDAYPRWDVNEKFKEIIDDVGEDSWDILVLGIIGVKHKYSQDKSYEWVKENSELKQNSKTTVVVPNGLHGSHAYIVKQTAYDQIIETFTKNVIWVDLMLTPAYLPSLKILTSKVLLFSQGENGRQYPKYYNVEENIDGPIGFHNECLPKGFLNPKYIVQKNMKIGLAAQASYLELPYLKEWIDWHKGLGVSDILLCLNDWDSYSRKQFNQMFQNELSEGWLHVFENQGCCVQISSYNQMLDAGKNYCLDWLVVIDIDEYLKIRSNRKIVDILSEHLDVPSLCVNWRLYGNNGHEAVKDNDFSIQKRFTRCEKTLNKHVKQIVNMHNRGTHCFVNPHYLNVFSVNLEGDQVNGPFNVKNLEQTHELEIAHYVTKSKDECRIRRSFRRDIGYPRKEGWEIFYERHNKNDIDESELQYKIIN